MSKSYVGYKRNGAFYLITETRIDMSNEAEILYKYALDKGDTFIWSNESIDVWVCKEHVFQELIDLGLFTLMYSDHGGYRWYKVTPSLEV